MKENVSFTEKGKEKEVEKSKTADQEAAENLLFRYGDIISAIKLKRPEEIEVGGSTLDGIVEKINEKKGETGKETVQYAIKRFLAGPQIYDVFNNDRNTRADWRKGIAKDLSPEAWKIFKENRFKSQNVYGVLQISLLLGELSPSLYEKVDNFLNEITSGENGGLYRNTTYEEKERILEKVDDLCKEILLGMLNTPDNS